MLARGLAILLIAATAILSVGKATADEVTVPLAISGNWAAVAHKASMVAPPDICIVAATDGRFALRADEDGVQIRIQNSAWSLPAEVQGTITLQVGSFQKTFDIDDNTSIMVNASIDDGDVALLFGAMDNNTNMSITVGKSPPYRISLVGSTMATNAFRTCAGIKSNAPTPGSNPFK